VVARRTGVAKHIKTCVNVADRLPAGHHIVSPDSNTNFSLPIRGTNPERLRSGDPTLVTPKNWRYYAAHQRAQYKPDGRPTRSVFDLHPVRPCISSTPPHWAQNLDSYRSRSASFDLTRSKRAGRIHRLTVDCAPGILSHRSGRFTLGMR